MTVCFSFFVLQMSEGTEDGHVLNASKIFSPFFLQSKMHIRTVFSMSISGFFSDKRSDILLKERNILISNVHLQFSQPYETILTVMFKTSTILTSITRILNQVLIKMLNHPLFQATPVSICNKYNLKIQQHTFLLYTVCPVYAPYSLADLQFSQPHPEW